MRLSALVVTLLAGVAGCVLTPAFGQTLIVGNDEKNGIENHKPIVREPGHDTLSVIDLSNPGAPRISATIPLMNSVVGPPTNLAIVPSGDIALVANSVAPEVEGWSHKLVPDNKVFVVDLKASPPKVIGTVTVGKQPSGMAISPKGDLALVANRADGTISVLVDPRQGRAGHRHGHGRRRHRQRLRRRDHPRRQARARLQGRRQQSGAAVDRRRQGQIRQERPGDRNLSLQRRRRAERQAGIERRQWRRRQLGRECRYRRRDRPRSQPAARHRPCDGRRFAGRPGDEPQGRRCGVGAGGRLEPRRPTPFIITRPARSRC